MVQKIKDCHQHIGKYFTDTTEYNFYELSVFKDTVDLILQHSLVRTVKGNYEATTHVSTEIEKCSLETWNRKVKSNCHECFVNCTTYAHLSCLFALPHMAPWSK